MTNPIIKEASDAVVRGEVIVFPTDTVFGIGCDPFNEDAIAQIFALKKRSLEKTLPILVDSIETAQSLTDIPESAFEALHTHWPGALTVVVPTKVSLPESLVHEGTIALRQPNHDDLLELITSVGGALVATSANISGHTALNTYDEAYAQFADSVPVIVPGKTREGIASTIVNYATDPPTVVRQGTVSLSCD